jgi:hypothetical protein
VEAHEVWELIVKADDALKYATEERAEVRRQQAEGLLRRALTEARMLGNENLVEQVQTRLEDLGIRDA